MVKTHRQVFERLGPAPVPAVILGTTYGFQTNAQEISARAVEYFRESIGRSVTAVPLAKLEGADPVELESSLATVAQARWIFAGPGSPTYALRQWRPTPLPALLAEKLAHGGGVVFASAAALTLGRWTVPVYEIYKVGTDPEWAEGLDLLSPFGLDVAVIPHFDNAEGGTHDTRFCHLGEDRLRALEEDLPPEGWVLGVDEHTACTLDLDAGTVTVSGRGTVTVRRRGSSVVVPAGMVVPIDQLARLVDAGAAAGGGVVAGSVVGSGVAGGSVAGGSVARGGGGAGGGGPQPGASNGRPGFEPGAPASRPGAPTFEPGAPTFEAGAPASQPGAPATGKTESPLLSEVHRLERTFSTAFSRRDEVSTTRAALELETTLHEWAADTYQSDELDRARAALRQMIARLGEAAGPGLREPREVAAPWVEALLAEREAARGGGRFGDADRIRDRLSQLGIEVRDTPEGTQWLLGSSAG